MDFKSGLFKINSFPAVVESEKFRELNTYSGKYLQNNQENLSNYRWIKDGLNQWSRIYEYQYAYLELLNTLPKGAKILDAGSGITFFPFFLSQQFSVTSVDEDDYAANYAGINKVQGSNVTFKQSPLKNIDLESNQFDAIFCISVLEHTNDYKKIIEEFHRLLKPNGLLVVTFDISLNDTNWGISFSDSANLLNDISTYFKIDYDANQLKEQLDQPGIYSTKHLVDNSLFERLPFPQPTIFTKIKSALGLSKNKTPHLTFCCTKGFKK